MNTYTKIKISNKFIKYVGYFLFILGLLLTFLRYYIGSKPDSFYLNVFAFYSVYVESKSFEIITNHILDEICGVLLVVGQYIVIWTFFQTPDNNTKTIIKAGFLAITSNTLLIIFGFVFFYGLAFLYVTLLNIISFNLFFILFFEFLKHREIPF